MVVNEPGAQEFELFLLGVAFPQPLLTVFLVLPFTLLEGTDKPAGDVSDHVKVVCNLDGGCSNAGRIDGS